VDEKLAKPVQELKILKKSQSQS